jgi:hypothetical protein
MKTNIISSGKNSSLTGEPRLPADFAQRVLMIARKKLGRRQLRNRIGATAAVLLLMTAVLLATLTRSRRASFASRDSTDLAKPAWQVQSSDDALAYQLVQTTTPRSAEDYLLPNAAALTGFTSAYSDESWQYDPRWTYYR